MHKEQEGSVSRPRPKGPRYGKVYEYALAMPGMSPAGRITYVALSVVTNRDVNVSDRAGQRKLAAIVSVSLDTIQRGVENLVEIGLIQKRSGDRTTANQYLLFDENIAFDDAMKRHEEREREREERQKVLKFPQGVPVSGIGCTGEQYTPVPVSSTIQSSSEVSQDISESVKHTLKHLSYLKRQTSGRVTEYKRFLSQMYDLLSKGETPSEKQTNFLNQLLIQFPYEEPAPSKTCPICGRTYIGAQCQNCGYQSGMDEGQIIEHVAQYQEFYRMGPDRILYAMDTERWEQWAAKLKSLGLYLTDEQIEEERAQVTFDFARANEG